jgi:hypothetical protein
VTPDKNILGTVMRKDAIIATISARFTLRPVIAMPIPSMTNIPEPIVAPTPMETRSKSVIFFFMKISF